MMVRGGGAAAKSNHANSKMADDDEGTTEATAFAPRQIARLVIPAGILRIPVFSSPVALFSQESRFLFLRNIFFSSSGILSVPGLRT